VQLKSPAAAPCLHQAAQRRAESVVRYHIWGHELRSPAAGVTRASQIPGSCRTPAYIRLLSAELEYPAQFPAGDVLVGYASTQLPQFPLTPPEADAFVSGEAIGMCALEQMWQGPPSRPHLDM
jgi:hypothetical protein